MRSLLITGAALALALTACSDKGGTAAAEGQTAAAAEATPVRMHRLDRLVERFGALTPQQQAAAIDSLRPGVEALLAITSSSSVPAVEALDSLSHTRATGVFGPDIEERYKGAANAERRLTGFASALRRELPEVTMPAVYAAIISYNQSVVLVADTVMLVGLNHYLGPDYPGYQGFPAWQRQLKSAERLPVDVAEAVLATAAPQPQPQAGAAYPPVISQMIRSGAITEAMTRTVPGLDARTALGLTKAEWQWLQANEARIWQVMAERQLLYSTDPAVAQRLLAPGGSASLIHSDAPSRTGAYIGWRIVSSYAERTGAPLSQLLSPALISAAPTAVLQQAAYAPR